jgi:hypothetical protein
MKICEIALPGIFACLQILKKSNTLILDEVKNLMFTYCAISHLVP